MPDTLYAIQMLNAGMAALPLSEESKEKLALDIQELDIALGSILLNVNDADLARLENLPDLLEALGLMSARMSLIYVLGHEDTLLTDGSVPGSESLESLRKMMNILASQPVATQAASKLIFNEPPESIATSVLGMKVYIEATSSTDESIQLAELIATALEAFFATAIQQDIIPHTEEFKIRVSVSDQLSKPSFVVDKFSLIGDLKWPAGLLPHSYSNFDVLRALLMEVVAKTLTQNFMLENTEAVVEALFANDGVQERMAMVMVLGNSYHRFAHRYLSRLGDWGDRMTTKYECRTRPPIEKQPLDAKPKREAKEPSKIKYERPKFDSHKHIKVHSVIDVHTWDQAKWRGAGYLRFDPDYPPVLALLFENEEAARAIFLRWRERVGLADRSNEIRVAIIRDYDVDYPTHYIVQIASGPSDFSDLEPRQSFIMTSRCLENTPDNDVNLSRFLQDHAEMGAYYLAAGIIQGGGENEPKWLDGMILKRELSVKRAADLTPTDIEMMALNSVQRAATISEDETA